MLSEIGFSVEYVKWAVDFSGEFSESWVSVRGRAAGGWRGREADRSLAPCEVLCRSAVSRISRVGRFSSSLVERGCC